MFGCRAAAIRMQVYGLPEKRPFAADSAPRPDRGAENSMDAAGTRVDGNEGVVSE